MQQSLTSTLPFLVHIERKEIVYKLYIVFSLIIHFVERRNFV